MGERGDVTDPEKVATAREWARPAHRSGVKAYLGFIGYYVRHCFKNFATLANLLNKLTAKGEEFLSEEEQENAFSTLKNKWLKLRH